MTNGDDAPNWQWGPVLLAPNIFDGGPDCNGVASLQSGKEQRNENKTKIKVS